MQDPVEVILEPVHHSQFGLTHILFVAPCALQAVDQIGALAVHVVFRDIPSSCGGGDSFSTLVHSGAIPAIRVVA